MIKKITISNGKVENRYLVLKKQTEEIEIHIGKSAKLNLYILAHSKKSQKVGCHIKIFHEKEGSESSINMYAIAQDTSLIEMTGVVIVGKGVKNSSVQVSQRGILLSDKASIKYQPFLRISDNRILGKHSVLISSPTNEQKYYMQSRGLKIKESEKLFISTLLHIPTKYTKI